MSLLSQESLEKKDDAALGESFTKGSGHLVVAGIIAAVVVTIAVAIYVIHGEKPPAATGQIVDIWAHPMHYESSGFDANGAYIPKESFDQVLVFTHVKLHNQSAQPIFLHEILTNIMLDDGAHSSYATRTTEYDRIFQAYPALAPFRTTPLSPELTINPGETKEGTFVCAFRISKDQWQARKSLDYTFGFQYLPNLKLPASGGITER
jgi:hypothetical protein